MSTKLFTTAYISTKITSAKLRLWPSAVCLAAQQNETFYQRQTSISKNSRKTASNFLIKELLPV